MTNCIHNPSMALDKTKIYDKKLLERKMGKDCV